MENPWRSTAPTSGGYPLRGVCERVSAILQSCKSGFREYTPEAPLSGIKVLGIPLTRGGFLLIVWHTGVVAAKVRTEYILWAMTFQECVQTLCGEALLEG